MVELTEITSDDGSNGGDPNKKAQEEENQNEKVIQEQVLYTFIGFPNFSRWYILHRINNSLRLNMIGSLPPMILGSAVVTIGHEIYIFGGGVVPHQPVPIVFLIDCRSHTKRRLPNMRRCRYHAAAGVIDGKIYVIGGCFKQGRHWIEVFDVNTQSWVYEPMHGGPNYPCFASFDGAFGESVVMKDKIYILDRMCCCLVYEPRRRRWSSLGNESLLRCFWNGSCCVIDDMLYTIDPTSILGYPIVVFDPKRKYWTAVKGVRRYELFSFGSCQYKVANLGGKLVILGRYASMYGWEWDYNYDMDRDIWCIVIALERREDGEILGIVESKSSVLSCRMLPWIEHSRTVTL